jgi:hypothetical protein
MNGKDFLGNLIGVLITRIVETLFEEAFQQLEVSSHNSQSQGLGLQCRGIVCQGLGNDFTTNWQVSTSINGRASRSNEFLK